MPIAVALVYVAMLAFLFNGGGHSRSYTSMVCLALGVFVLWVLNRFRGRERQIFLVFVSSLAGVALFSVFMDFVAGMSIVDAIALLLGKDTTLTGRNLVWQESIRLGMRHPTGGYGYGAFWLPWITSQMDPRVDFGPGQAHNGYVETFVNLGIVGVVLLFLMSFRALRQASNLFPVNFEAARLRFALLVVILVLNYSEATFPRGTHLFWYVFLLTAMVYKPAHETVAAKASQPHKKPWQRYKYGRFGRIPRLQPDNHEAAVGKGLRKSARRV
jgi:O-antigen ligase